jgi:hypothetical protein
MVVRESDRLEQTARKVAFGRLPVRADVREAVRDLTLTALRSRVLTLPHVASVANAIAHGIDPTRAQSKSAPRTSQEALEGLREAVGKALVALDIAAREYVAVGGRLSCDELEEWMRAIEAMSRIGGAEIERRVAELRTTLHAAESDEAAEGTYVLGLLSSGALLGLLEAAPRPAPQRAAKA